MSYTDDTDPSMTLRTVLDMLDSNEIAMVTLPMTSLEYNDETAEEIQSPPRFDEVSIIKTSILGVMCLIGLVGNVLVLVQIYRRSRPLSSINMLIAHLAVSDLIVTIFCNVTDAIWESTIQW